MSANTIEELRAHHRMRRYAIKMQSKIDRGIESFIRINATDWSPDVDEATREAENRKMKAILAAARKDEGDPAIIELVKNTDMGREPFDAVRAKHEKTMEKLAKDLPVADWIKSIRGAGLLGLATIVAEAGDPVNYRNPAKLWKRLGFAPYDGYAGSTWKRDSWRPRKLTKDEWIENPFSGERYALIHQIAVWLVNAQVEASEKSGTEFGRSTGPYGMLYVERREVTKAAHPDWTKAHGRMDAVRVTMKKFLLDLWLEWHVAVGLPARVSRMRGGRERAQRLQKRARDQERRERQRQVYLQG